MITVWNPGAERLYGYAASEVIGRPASLLIPPARHGEDQEILSRVLAGERLEHYRTGRVCKDGSVVNVSLSVSAIRDVDGQVIGASSIARDMTAAVRAQERIALQAQLLDEVDAAVIVTDAEGVIRYWNSGAQRLYGYAAEETAGHRLFDLIMPEESRAEALSLRRGARAGRPLSGELDVRDKQGRVFPVDFRLRGVSLHGAGEASVGTISVSIDISARRKAMEALRRHAEQQEEIANLGRLALMGDSLDELLDYAVRTASRILSADCAWVVERLPDASDFVVRAAVGWPSERKGERVAG